MRSPTTGKPFAIFQKSGPRWTGKVELIREKLYEPLRWRKPCDVFVNSMSDLYHESLPDAAIIEILAVIALCPHIRFQVLTKRARRMRALMNATKTSILVFVEACRILQERKGEAPPPVIAWPLKNLDLGVSVEDQETADERVGDLLATLAARRFCSYEPGLGEIDFRHIHHERMVEIDALAGTHGVIRPHRGESPALDLIILGGESGPHARPYQLAWLRRVIRDRRAAKSKTRLFVKQLGARPVSGLADMSYTANMTDRAGGKPEEWPPDLRIRERLERAA